MADAETNRAYFSHPETVAEYARAVAGVGLWESERILIARHIPRDARVLELGCGAGRVAFAMAREGWGDITATDFSPEMTGASAWFAEREKLRVRVETADATALPYPNHAYDAAIFAFNGLLMIPGPGRREAAMREIARTLKPGGVFIFSGHDREATRLEHWSAEERRWAAGEREPAADAFGDILYPTPRGRVYIRSTTEAEIGEELERAGFTTVFSAMRSAIARESPATLAFSDDTRMRVCVRR